MKQHEAEAGFTIQRSLAAAVILYFCAWHPMHPLSRTLLEKKATDTDFFLQPHSPSTPCRPCSKPTIRPQKRDR